MPYKTFMGMKYRTGRLPYALRKKRRVTKRKNVRVPRRTLNSTGTISIKRKWWVQNWVPSTVTTNDFFRNFKFNLGNIPNYLEFTNLFEYYMITGWLIELVPRYDIFAGNDTTDTTLPGITNMSATRVLVNIDRNDESVPSGTYTSATLNTLLESGSTKTYMGNRTIKIFIRNPAANDTIGGTTGARVRRRWINTSTAPDHWGAKVFMYDVNFTGNFGNQYDIFYTAYLKFKGVQ